jgi:hypothetical protein
MMIRLANTLSAPKVMHRAAKLAVCFLFVMSFGGGDGFARTVAGCKTQRARCVSNCRLGDTSCFEGCHANYAVCIGMISPPKNKSGTSPTSPPPKGKGGVTTVPVGGTKSGGDTTTTLRNSGGSGGSGSGKK